MLCVSIPLSSLSALRIPPRPSRPRRGPFSLPVPSRLTSISIERG